MATFRLLSAQTVAHVERRPWRPGHRAPSSPPIEVTFGAPGGFVREPDQGGHVSVLLGRNGEGKSRLLSAIATSFQLLQDYARAGSPRGLPLSHLEYFMDGRHHLITTSLGKPELTLDGLKRPVQEAMLPSRVIGLSMTPFDKFPIGGERQLDLFEPEQPEVYAYLGMRERLGRSSTTAMLTRAIEGMFSRLGLGDRGRVTEVFALLGFEPQLTTVFRLETSRMVNALAEGASPADLLGMSFGRSFLNNRLERMSKEAPQDIEALRLAAGRLLARVERNFIPLLLDVSRPDPDSLNAYRDVQQLRRAGLARLFAVEARRPSGALIDLKEASSGELSMALTFMSLAANLDDGALVLIDEPETNLHPEWQSTYIDLLLGTFKAFHGCHYVLATHSPLILRDAPPNATLASLHNSDLQSGREVSGQPVDYLLVKAFNVASGSNYYIQEELIKALRLAADGQVNGPEFQQTVRGLSEIQSLIKDSPGVIELIDDLRRIAERSVG